MTPKITPMPSWKNPAQSRPRAIQKAMRRPNDETLRMIAEPRMTMAVSDRPMVPANIGVRPENSSQTSTNSGISRYQRSLTAAQALGHSSFGRPLRPARLASRWTIQNTEPKYSSAGISAALAISTKGTLMVSAMMKATAPITGGMIWLPIEDVASTPPAKAGR